ncbi:mannitol dehydrogenase family protein [Caulobacter mirabilis]|uniref:mannitol dehydrogenase family protein n=1 Tax=Caulobacter mirabilis TaxID=69666 RepID=UPI001FE5B530|nr:mannitol dehydrogenase family protein [Caulobacter mirabilis]
MNEAALQTRRPLYDRSKTTIGVVHFGPGAFHRAHQAVYFDRLLAADPRWAICGVSLRSSEVQDALAPQDGLYTLLELGERTRPRIIGALTQILVAPREPEAVAARLAAPTTHLVTLTVTQSGYCLTPEGVLDLAHPDIIHDLSGAMWPRSVEGWLVEGLRRRRAARLPAFTVLSCDDLPSNGRRLREAVIAFAALRDPELARWIARETRFPRTLSDSITPATDDALRLRAGCATGLMDAWPVQREPFSQWVIEDDLGPDRDALAVIATLTDEVEAWEQAQRHLLGGVRTSLAYLGLLRGRRTVRDAVADEPLIGFLRAMLLDEIVPVLQAPRDFNASAYVEALFERFRNPAIEHKLSQLAWDGSDKLPARILPIIADALAADRSIRRLAYPVAAWMRFVVRQAAAAAPLTDPLAGTLATLGRQCGGDAARDIERFLTLDCVFPARLTQDARFREALAWAYARLPSELDSGT